MMTLAGPPRATPAESMASLQLAWKRMRSWFHKKFGKSFEFVMVIEVGSRNGLIHMHCLALFPGRADYGECGEAWARAYPGAVTGGCHFSTREVYKDGEKTGRYTSIFTPDSGAYYIAKYATKGSELLKLPAQMAARTIAAMSGRRIVRASQGFWTPADPICSDCGWKFGMASGEDLAHSIGIYIDNQEHRARQVARNANSPNAPNAGETRRATKFPIADWGERIEGARVLVAAKREILEGMVPDPRKARSKWIEANAGSFI
jgi:hypothetical protein